MERERYSIYAGSNGERGRDEHPRVRPVEAGTVERGHAVDQGQSHRRRRPGVAPGAAPLAVGHVEDALRRSTLDLGQIEHDDVGRLADLDLPPVVEPEEVGQLSGEIVDRLFDGEQALVPGVLGEQVDVIADSTEHLAVRPGVRDVPDRPRVLEQARHELFGVVDHVTHQRRAETIVQHPIGQGIGGMGIVSSPLDVVAQGDTDGTTARLRFLEVHPFGQPQQ